MHQRIKRIADYNPISKEISIPNNVDSALKNRYIIELRDKFNYNIQLSIPIGSAYITDTVKRLNGLLEKSRKETTKLQKAIDALQNSCEHKMDDGADAFVVIAHTHREINECLICKKTVTA